MSKTDNWATLEDLDRKLRDAADRSSEIRARSANALRAVAVARADLTAYSESVFNGEREEDAAEEAKLIGKISEAEAMASTSVSEARQEAAERARMAAEEAVRRFESEHLEDLLGDHAPRAYEAAEGLQRAFEVREAAEREYAIAQRRSFRLAAIAGRSADDVPRNPLAWRTRRDRRSVRRGHRAAAPAVDGPGADGGEQVKGGRSRGGGLVGGVGSSCPVAAVSGATDIAIGSSPPTKRGGVAQTTRPTATGG